MIAIIDYNAGNLKSVEKALHFLGEECVITRDFHEIEAADKGILPGVGAFGDAMEQLKKYELDKVIHEVAAENKPFLGICLGLQLLFEGSDESQGVEGLCLMEKSFVFRISRDLRFRILDGIPCICRTMEGFLPDWKKIHMYISFIPII
mgnify:FL=1